MSIHTIVEVCEYSVNISVLFFRY